MLVRLILACALLFAFDPVSAQTDTIRGEAARDLLKQIGSQVFDTARFLAKAGQEACACIDSIQTTGKSREQTVTAISACIDKQVTGYQAAIKLYRSMISGDDKITVETNKSTAEYKRYYFELESWLRDSCASLDRKVASDDQESQVSVSSNPNARAAYSRGVDEMKAGRNQEAADYFKTALSIDSVFTFAWDNLGLCYRKLGEYDKALQCYRKSLSFDPKGKLPLQNIPIVYEYMGDHDRALAGYQELLRIYPDDPEAFYGAGRIYAMKKNHEEALDQLCKAYNLYTKMGSPYRVDAEKNIRYLYSVMKEEGKEKKFMEILERNHIRTN